MVREVTLDSQEREVKLETEVFRESQVNMVKLVILELRVQLA